VNASPPVSVIVDPKLWPIVDKALIIVLTDVKSSKKLSVIVEFVFFEWSAYNLSNFVDGQYL
jgi:hypothetical protein